MRILFLHEVSYLGKPVFEMHEFPEYLAARGHHVGFVDFLGDEEFGRSERFGEYIEGRTLHEARIQLFSQPTAHSGILGRLTSAILFPRFFRRALEAFQPDIVVSYAVPTSGWQALRMSKKRGVPFVFRALDVSHKIRRTLFAPLIKFAERYIYKRSDWLSCNNPSMREYCISLGARPDKSSVELPPIDLNHFQMVEIEKQVVRRRLGISSDATVILYMGSFFYFSGLDEVIRSLSEIRNKPLLVLIGGGEQESQLKDLANQFQLENYVKFTGFVSFHDLPSYLSIANVAINPMLPTLVANAALPNKIIQYMAMGLPVVSTELRGLKSIFAPGKGIRLVPSPDLVLSSALSLADTEKIQELGNANRQLVLQTFDVKASVDSFEQLLIKAVRF